MPAPAPPSRSCATRSARLAPRCATCAAQERSEMLVELRERRGVRWQETKDGIPTCWIDPDGAHDLLRELASEVDQPYRTLYDLTVIDERRRARRDSEGD